MEDADRQLAEVEREPRGGESFADQLLDDLLPEEIEWRRLLAEYPLATLAAAGVGGYLLGRARGGAIVGALAAFASDTVSRNVNTLIGEDVL